MNLNYCLFAEEIDQPELYFTIIHGGNNNGYPDFIRVIILTKESYDNQVLNLDKYINNINVSKDNYDHIVNIPDIAIGIKHPEIKDKYESN